MFSYVKPNEIGIRVIENCFKIMHNCSKQTRKVTKLMQNFEIQNVIFIRKYDFSKVREVEKNREFRSYFREGWEFLRSED